LRSGTPPHRYALLPVYLAPHLPESAFPPLRASHLLRPVAPSRSIEKPPGTSTQVSYCRIPTLQRVAIPYSYLLWGGYHVFLPGGNGRGWLRCILWKESPVPLFEEEFQKGDPLWLLTPTSIMHLTLTPARTLWLRRFPAPLFCSGAFSLSRF